MKQEIHQNPIVDARSFGDSPSERLRQRSVPIQDRNLLVDEIDSIVIVPEQVVKNVEAITSHQERHQQNTTTPQRILEKITTMFGRSEFLYFQVGLFAIWGACTHLVELGILPPNFPTFDLREQGLDVASLLISTGVLVYETRQERVSEERSHLMLQLNLLTEQKIAKLISLVEELRQDLPNVSNRFDLEAELMKQATDPQAILEVIQQNLDQPTVSPSEDTQNEK